MSRKHHTKHFRSSSRYPDRLRARGESSATVRMLFIDARGRKFQSMDDLLRRRNVEPVDEVEEVA